MPEISAAFPGKILSYWLLHKGYAPHFNEVKKKKPCFIGLAICLVMRFGKIARPSGKSTTCRMLIACRDSRDCFRQQGFWIICTDKRYPNDLLGISAWLFLSGALYLTDRCWLNDFPKEFGIVCQEATGLARASRIGVLRIHDPREDICPPKGQPRKIRPFTNADISLPGLWNGSMGLQS
jgi:hypothetical protein